MPIEVDAAKCVRRVLGYRQQAKLGQWVTYAQGEPADRRHPVSALVNGWAKLRLVELREDAGPKGQRWHQFRRLAADFPAGWHSEPEPLAQPPSRRDPESVGIEWMAYCAGLGDERPEWLHYAAAHYRARLFELAAAGADDLPADAADTLTQAGFVLLTLEHLLHPDLPTPVQLRTTKRPITEAEKAADIAAGRKPRRSRMTFDRARKEHDAALQVERAMAGGDNPRSAITDASGEHSVPRGDIGKRLSNRAAWRRWPADAKLAEAADIAGALQAGGLLQKDALAVASELTGQEATGIRKTMKSR